MQVGFVKLVQSSKATMSLIILACATTGMMLGKLDGVSYAAVVGTLGSIFMWTQNRADMAANKMPERGQ